jgi:pimeloyl-ACP methyl ester carboxylesterase
VRARSIIVLALLVVGGATTASCASDGGTGSAGSDAPAATGDRCIVRLHGKGGTGTDPVIVDGVVELSPTGNAEGWGGREWRYFPDDRYAEAVAIVATAVDGAGCTRVVVDGFSNGAAFAAKLWCRSETLGGRLAGVVIDDPVPDQGTAGCAPATGVPAALYWTGALAATAIPGADCGPIDWTCEGGSLVGIDAYAATLGLAVQPSPLRAHEWQRTASELTAWLG